MASASWTMRIKLSKWSEGRVEARKQFGLFILEWVRKIDGSTNLVTRWALIRVDSFAKNECWLKKK